MVMDFSALPQELQELILSKLSLLNLAYASATCRLFQAVFREQLARDQAARCELAAQCYGRERIAALVALIVRWVEGEPLVAIRGGSSEIKMCWICQDGKFHEWRPNRQLPAVRFTEATGDMTCRGLSGPITLLYAGTEGRDRKLSVELEIDRVHKHATSFVHLSNDHDLEGVALVQALLSEGLAKIFHGDGGWGLEILGMNTLSTQDFNTLVTPLMPFVTLYG